MPTSRSVASADAIAQYLDELTGRLQARLGDRLVAAWVVGSRALGDFDPERSDIDVQAVSAQRLAQAELEALTTELSHYALPCPVRGLEFVLYAREDLTDPRGPAFSLNLNSGRGAGLVERLRPRPGPDRRRPCRLLGRDRSLALQGHGGRRADRAR